MKMRAFAVVLLLGLLAFVSGTVQAKDLDFEFYYQKIDEVVQINNPEPKGWWEKTKAFGKNILNASAKLWEKSVTRNFFPGEGKKTWYSSEDKNIAYKLTRVKVRDEAHLLALMGAKGDESKLTDGQRALLAAYRHSKSKAIIDRMKYNSRSSLIVMMTDTGGLEDEGGKYANIRRDFWPCSTGRAIQISSFLYDYPGSEADVRSTFVHEFSHSLDHTVMEFIKPYGPDKSHYVDEKTGKRAAFIEGWAEFNQMLDSDSKAENMRESVKNIRIENPKKAGEYSFKDAKDLSGSELANVEGINALIMWQIAREIPGGQDKVFRSFKASNYPWRNLRHLLRDLVKKNPGDAAKVAKILDEETLGKLSESDLKGFLGRTPAAAAAISAIRKTSEQPLPVAPAKISGTTIENTKPALTGSGKSPFADQ